MYIIDEIHSFIAKKVNKYRWFNIFHAITGRVYRFVFGWRDYETMEEFFERIRAEVWNIKFLCMDNRDSFKKIADKCNIESIIGKEYTWKLERFHLTVRTALSRFVRKGIRYSKSSSWHLKVYWLFIHYYNSTL